ncbi:hypothetical protein Mro03_51430 [Microbispora rosea subsp. rosea]|nr:hypothetical protein Mro03_51430 [Microbispora rosea subsp. rosea]
MLKASGASADMCRAVWRHNHADWYVGRVFDFARGYSSSSAGVGRSCVRFLPRRVPWPAVSSPTRGCSSASRTLGELRGRGAGGPGHAGIVVTPGQMIHAPHTRDVVCYASYSAGSDVVGLTRAAGRGRWGSGRAGRWGRSEVGGGQ